MPPTGRPAPGRPGPRERRDRCPGALRPWAAEDGLLVRLRIIGGHLPVESLQALVAAAERYGDGRVHVTVRANLQLRGFPSEEDRPDRNEVPGGAAPASSSHLAPEAVDALEATGLLPSRTHELVRNVMVSPGTGLWGGRADLRPVADELDRLLRAAPHRAQLPGRFLFVLDDGRGDLLERTCDLGLVALDEHWAQLRVGDGWGPVVALPGADVPDGTHGASSATATPGSCLGSEGPVTSRPHTASQRAVEAEAADASHASDTSRAAQAARALVELADRFLELRGDGDSAAWHVTELPDPLTAPVPPDPRSPPPAPPLPYGPVPGGGRHVPVPDAGLDRAAADALAEEARAAGGSALVVTPWRGVLVPGTPGAPSTPADGTAQGPADPHAPDPGVHAPGGRP